MAPPGWRARVGGTHTAVVAGPVHHGLVVRRVPSERKGGAGQFQLLHPETRGFPLQRVWGGSVPAVHGWWMVSFTGSPSESPDLPPPPPTSPLALPPRVGQGDPRRRMEGLGCEGALMMSSIPGLQGKADHLGG